MNKLLINNIILNFDNRSIFNISKTCSQIFSFKKKIRRIFLWEKTKKLFKMNYIINSVYINHEENLREIKKNDDPNKIFIKNIYLANTFNNKIFEWPDIPIRLFFHIDYNQPLNNLPNSIIEIKLGDYFNQVINKKCFINANDSKLKIIHFGYNYNKLIDDLPDSITFLDMSRSCIEHINKLPSNLKKIVFGPFYNETINKWPHLKEIRFGIYYNQPLLNLPTTLKKLTLGYHFNQNIDHLPDNIVELELGSQYNVDIKKLPQNLKIFRLGYSYNLPLQIQNILPHLETIVLVNKYNFPLPVITENYPLVNWMPNIKRILLSSEYTFPIKDSGFPESLELIVRNSSEHAFTENYCVIYQKNKHIAYYDREISNIFYNGGNYRS